MPLLRPDALLLGILVISAPLQYLIVKYWGRTEAGRTYALHELISSLGKFHSEYLEWESWKQWCLALVSTKEAGNSPSSLYPTDPDDPLGESPAVEVMRYKQKDGYFTLSPEPRAIRSPYVKYRVGQVIIHKHWKYRGVIIGWDEKAKAPKEWLDAMHGKGNSHWRNMPNYAVLVDIRDRLTPQLTYVPEENLQVVKNVKVMHPLLDEHFEHFDGAQYLPRPWLKAVYPLD